ncbi:Transketolase [Dorcoceras hygrometricum]|uniref:Transketolase n=1 Tax=Dorcoceras hygrometricum TaxID=472368 RepID=A0A2Z7BBM4_9LAMI|nr:Transketolase [Dorcoceras hygrometricum]
MLTQKLKRAEDRFCSTVKEIPRARRSYGIAQIVVSSFLADLSPAVNSSVDCHVPYSHESSLALAKPTDPHATRHPNTPKRQRFRHVFAAIHTNAQISPATAAFHLRATINHQTSPDNLREQISLKRHHFTRKKLTTRSTTSQGGIRKSSTRLHRNVKSEI